MAIFKDDSIQINGNAKIVTMYDGEKRLVYGRESRVRPTRRELYETSKGDIPLKYVCDFEQWLRERKEKEEKRRKAEEKWGPFAPIVNYASAILRPPDETYFTPDKYTKMMLCPDGSFHINKIQSPESRHLIDEGATLSPEQYRFLLFEAEKYAKEIGIDNA